MSLDKMWAGECAGYCPTLSTTRLLKKIILTAVLATAFFMPLQARMYPTTLRMPAVCWNDLTEALTFHAQTYSELPILKLFPLEGQESHGVLLVNPAQPSWTFLYFRITEGETKTICSIASGKEWDILNPPGKQKTEL